jgi:hypothetical protein
MNNFTEDDLYIIGYFCFMGAAALGGIFFGGLIWLLT